MDTKKIGQFLAQLRKERGLTQDALGVQLGVTNKTVSRWENGNYLPPAEILKLLSDFYGVTINEILSARRLDVVEYQRKAEENIAEVLEKGHFAAREKWLAMGQWLWEKWWLVLLCLAPAVAGYSLLPLAVGSPGDAVRNATLLLVTGILILFDHGIVYVSERAGVAMEAEEAFRPVRIMRIVWLIFLAISLFLCAEIGLAAMYAMTPAGTVDGYSIQSVFYGILIEDHGNYLDQCWIALRRCLWQTFSVTLVNIDLTILWMKHR